MFTFQRVDIAAGAPASARVVNAAWLDQKALEDPAGKSALAESGPGTRAEDPGSGVSHCPRSATNPIGDHQRENAMNPTMRSILLIISIVATAPVSAAASFDIAALRVREAESINRLSDEGRYLFELDTQKRTGYQYCSNAVSLAENGEFREAVRSASKALFLGLKDRNEDLVAQAKRDLAMAYSYAGNLDRAQQYAEQAINHFSKNRNQVHAAAYKTLGDVSFRRGDYAKAVANYQSALSRSDHRFSSMVKVSLANAHAAAGDTQKAEVLFKEVESEIDARSVPLLRRGQGNLALKQGKFDEALRRFTQAAEDKSEDTKYQRVWSLEGIARAQLGKQDKPAAIKTYIEAITEAEQVRARFRSDEFKTGLFGEMQRIFDDTVELLMESGESELAWEISERGRARALLDMVRNRVQISSGSTVLADPLANSTSLKDIQARLNPAEAIVEFHVLRTRTYAWVIRNSGMNSVVLDMKREDLANRVEALRDAIAERKPQAGTLSASLFDSLMRPLGLRDSESVVFVAHDALHYLPFQALHDGKSWLIEKHSISYAPSAATFSHLLGRQELKSGQLLALGNPDLGSPAMALPGAQREVERLKALFPESEIYVGKQATKERLLQGVKKSNTLHLAAHAEVDALDPLYSRIRLASTQSLSGDLEAHEVFRQDLSRSSLVVLSACSSGLGKVSTGDEIWGFTRAFLGAGASSLLVSLWPVADESTERLMAGFYGERAKGANKQRALQSAQLELLKDERFRAPFFWAPFNLIGDGR